MFYMYMLDIYERFSTDGSLFRHLSQFRQQTALHMAVEKGYHEIVQLLMEGRADPNKQDRVRAVYIL